MKHQRSSSDHLESTCLNRRQFTQLALAAPLLTPTPECGQLAYGGGLTDIQGIRVGHFTFESRPTGCTVVLAEAGAVAGVDVRGSAPGTRETDLLNPISTVQRIHALVLAGGSAFGLAAAAGAVRYLEEKGVGFDMGKARVPIVPAAVLYDLGLGDPRIRPNEDSAYRACVQASSKAVVEGNVGAGAGATVGKLFGLSRGMKGGLGSAGIQVGKVVVAALAAVNAVGDVLDPKTGRLLAGARKKDGKSLINTVEALKKRLPLIRGKGGNTTLVVVATNAAFDKAGMTKIAQMSQDGLARAVNPSHTPLDGDTAFALSTGEFAGADLGQVGALAAEVTTEAIVRGILTARGIPGFPAHCDLRLQS
ncbi:MAG: P1 family peptidase [Acidobacteriota bacterium]